MFEAVITGIGTYLPLKKITNDHFSSYLETSHEWIFERTGIRERRWAEEESTSDMGAKAAINALENANKKPNEIDLIIVATMSPDYLTPATAALIQAKIGAHRAAGFDVIAACSGFIYLLSIAKSFIQSGTYKTILIIGAEKMSSIIDPEDRSTVVLFGDGAGAVLVECQDKSKRGLKIGDILLGLKGELSSLLYIPSGGTIDPFSKKSLDERGQFLKMNGKEVFKMAVKKGIELIQQLVPEGVNKIDHFLFHQANNRIIRSIQEKLEIEEDKVLSTVEWTANTSAASLPILLAQKTFLLDKELILIAFGAGFTYGGARLKAI